MIFIFSYQQHSVPWNMLTSEGFASNISFMQCGRDLSLSSCPSVQPMRLERLETSYCYSDQLASCSGAQGDSEPTGGARRRRALHAVETLGKGLACAPQKTSFLQAISCLLPGRGSLLGKGLKSLGGTYLCPALIHIHGVCSGHWLLF